VIILSGTTHKTELITSAAGLIHVHTSLINRTAAAPPVETPVAKNYIITTATTTTIGESPTSTDTRNIKMHRIRNAHASVSNTVTFRHVDGTNTVEGEKCTLLPGEVLLIDDNGTYTHYDAQAGIYSGPSGDVDPFRNDFRLSGVSQTPVMVADSTTLSTVYLAQYKGNRIALFDGTNWQIAMPPSEVSLAVTGRTTDLPFDVFAYLNAGVVTLEFLNWTSATARATGLTRLDGVWTKTGDATRRYLGSIRARSATTFHWVMVGTDLPVKLDLFNADNRVQFNWFQQASTATWAYTVATIRQAQASANYQVDVMVGLQEEWMDALLEVNVTNSTISIGRAVGIGFDSTSTFVAGQVQGGTINTVASIQAMVFARMSHQPTIGRHFYSWNETSVATGTCTWTGRAATAGFNQQSGMTGEWTC
jgi:hypothetical protein